jgi:hypothetical protein
MLKITDAKGSQLTALPGEVAQCVGVFNDMIATVTETEQEPVVPLMHH